MIAILAVILAACGKTKVEKLVDVLNTATTQIQQCKDRDAVLKVEQDTQNKIMAITGDDNSFKPTEEDVKQLQPALDAYYQAFYEKAISLGYDNTEVAEQPAPQQGQPTDSIATE